MVTRPRLITATTMAITFFVLMLVTGAPFAAMRVVDGDGHWLSISVAYDSTNPSVQGLVLTDEAPNGATTAETIYATWDPIVDKDPWLAIDPYNGQPVIFWSRQDGADFEIAMMRHMPAGWGPLDMLTNNSSSDVAPRAIIDALERAHIVWYPAGIGGPVYLQSFDVHNGQPLGSPAKPLEAPSSKPLLMTGTVDGSAVGGGDDPGLIGGLTTRASESPCTVNPGAAPDHGALIACGRPAAYQLSSCKLVVGV